MNLIEKLKNMKEDTKKRILATALAGSMVAGSIPMASCTPKDNSTETNYSSTTNQNTSSTYHSGNKENNSSNKDDLYSQCSESLRIVMTDDYYRNLILTSESYVNSSLQVCHARNDNRYMAIPYGFLEDAGYDVTSIKKGIIKCSSQMYTDNNDLHIELRVLKGGYSDKGYIDYYTCYDLKYELTDKELNELDALFTQVYPNKCFYKGSPITYYEAPLFIQELSYHKTPEVLSVAHIEKETLDAVGLTFDKRDITTDYYHYITYKGPTYTNTINHLTQHTFLSHFNLEANRGIKKNERISIITLQTLGTAIRVVDSDEVLYSPDTADDFNLRAQFKDAYNNSFRDVTIYNCQRADFVRLEGNVLEDLYGQSLSK